MNLNIIVKKSRGYQISEYENLVIVANIYNGMNFKMTKECYDILIQYLNADIKISDFLELFESDEDRQYFKNLFEVLINYGILDEGNDEISISPVFMLTERCNLNCTHCCIDAKEIGCKSDLSTKQWKSIIDKFIGLNIDYVTVTGGEPMVRSDFFDISEYIKDTLNVPMVLMSNATLITESNASKLLELYDDFSFSLDGADEESCAPIRGEGVFNIAMKAIQLMKDNGMEHFSLSFTKVKQNESKEEEFRTLANELGAYPMIRNFDVVGRAKKHSELLIGSVDDQFIPTIADCGNDEGHYYPESLPICGKCSALENKMCISFDGSIYPCQLMMFPEFKIGNILDIDSFSDYWKSEQQFNTIGFENFNECRTATSQKCSNCPVKLHCTHCVLYTYLMKNRDDFEQLCEKKKEVLLRIWK